MYNPVKVNCCLFFLFVFSFLFICCKKEQSEEPSSLGIYIPNTFTPNGDGIDDYFVPFGLFNDLEMKIYSERGNLIYHGRGMSIAWNGKLSDTQPMPVGSYNWSIWLTDTLNQPHDFTGKVNLVR